MRPLKKPSTPTTYAEMANTFVVRMKTYPSMDIQTIYAFFGTHNWYDLQKKKIADRTQTESADLEKKIFLVGKLGNFYPEARRDLIAALGEVCSYCGMPVRDDAHVEHISPKNWFPDQMLLWNNFLLACRDCNSRKSQRPNGTPNDTLNDYVWPHTNFHGGMTGCKLRIFEYWWENKKSRSPAGTKRVDTQAFVERIRYGNLQVRFNSDQKTEPELTYLEPNPNDDRTYNIAAMISATSDVAAVAATIRNLLRLNAYPLDMTVGDRRLIERTQAWVQATDALHNCLSVARESDTVREAFLRQIEDTISATGFWEAWVDVLIFEGCSALDESDLSLFKIILARLAGTDDTRLPFALAS